MPGISFGVCRGGSADPQLANQWGLVISWMALLIIPYFETIRVSIPYLNQNHILGHAIGIPLLLVPVILTVWKPLRFLPEINQN